MLSSLTCKPTCIRPIGALKSFSILESSFVRNSFSTGGARTNVPTISEWSRNCARIVSASMPIC